LPSAWRSRRVRPSGLAPRSGSATARANYFPLPAAASPPTFRAADREALGIAFAADRLLDPSYNARLGAAHLAELMQDWKGSHLLTFAAYNAGGPNVSKWDNHLNESVQWEESPTVLRTRARDSLANCHAESPE